MTRPPTYLELYPKPRIGAMSQSLLYLPGAPRLIWMDPPASPEGVAAIAAELEWHHENHYMVWNVSGTAAMPYDPEAFGGRVVQLRFAGYLCPPLLMLLEACTSIRAWLRADPANHVVVHCRSGRGRSAVVLACAAAVLAIHGDATGPTSPIDWLSHLAHLRNLDESAITLPTHRRYLAYFAELLLSGPPSSAEHDGCELRAVVLHHFPALQAPPSVQLTVGTTTIYTGDAATMDATDEGDAAARRTYSYSVPRPPAGGGGGGADGDSGAPVLRVDGVLSIREQSSDGPLLCRAGFHPDFVVGAGVLRLTCAALDGAASRLPSDCFIDLLVARRPPAHGRAGTHTGTVGALSAALTSLRISERRAELAKGGDRARPSEAAAWGAMRQPEAVFSLTDGEEEEEEGGAAGGAVGGAVLGTVGGHAGVLPLPPPTVPSAKLLVVPTALSQAGGSPEGAPPSNRPTPSAAPAAPAAPESSGAPDSGGASRVLSPLELLHKYSQPAAEPAAAAAPTPSAPSNAATAPAVTGQGDGQASAACAEPTTTQYQLGQDGVDVAAKHEEDGARGPPPSESAIADDDGLPSSEARTADATSSGRHAPELDTVCDATLGDELLDPLPPDSSEDIDREFDALFGPADG